MWPFKKKAKAVAFPARVVRGVQANKQLAARAEKRIERLELQIERYRRNGLDYSHIKEEINLLRMERDLAMGKVKHANN